MKKFKNVSPMGDLELPALGLLVPHGATLEVSDEDATGFEGQAGTWEPVPAKSAAAQSKSA